MWVTIEFWSSQVHVTSTEANHIWSPDKVWSQYRSPDLDLNKNQMFLQKVPCMQNFKSFGPLETELEKVDFFDFILKLL